MAGVHKRHTARNVGHKCCAVGVIATESRHISGDVSCIAELVGTADTVPSIVRGVGAGPHRQLGETGNPKYVLD